MFLLSTFCVQNRPLQNEMQQFNDYVFLLFLSSEDGIAFLTEKDRGSPYYLQKSDVSILDLLSLLLLQTEKICMFSIFSNTDDILFKCLARNGQLYIYISWFLVRSILNYVVHKLCFEPKKEQFFTAWFFEVWTIKFLKIKLNLRQNERSRFEIIFLGTHCKV